MSHLYTTLKFWFFEILKSYNNAVLFIGLWKQSIVFFFEIKQKSTVKSSQ